MIALKMETRSLTFQITPSDRASISCVIESFNASNRSDDIGFAKHSCETLEVFSLLDCHHKHQSDDGGGDGRDMPIEDGEAAADESGTSFSRASVKDMQILRQYEYEDDEDDDEIVQLCQFNREIAVGDTEIILVFTTKSGNLYKISFISSHLNVFLSLRGFGDCYGESTRLSSSSSSSSSSTSISSCDCQFCQFSCSNPTMTSFAEGTIADFIFSYNEILYLLPRGHNFLIAVDMVLGLGSDPKFSVEFPSCDRNVCAALAISLHDNYPCRIFQKQVLGQNSSIRGSRLTICVGTENGSLYVFSHPRDEILSIGPFTIFPKLIHSVNCKVNRIFKSNFSYYFDRYSTDSKLSGAVYENGISHFCVLDEDSNVTCIGLHFVRDAVLGCNFVVEIPSLSHSVIVFENSIIYTDVDGEVYSLRIMLETPIDTLHKMYIEHQNFPPDDDESPFNVSPFRMVKTSISAPILLSTQNSPAILAFESIYTPSYASDSNYKLIPTAQSTKRYIVSVEGCSNSRILTLTERNIDSIKSSSSNYTCTDLLLKIFGNKVSLSPILSSSEGIVNNSMNVVNSRGASDTSMHISDNLLQPKKKSESIVPTESGEAIKTKLTLSIQLETCYRQLLFEINSEILQKAALLSFIREFNGRDVDFRSSKHLDFDVQLHELASRETYLRIKLSVSHTTLMKALNGKYLSFSFNPLAYPSNQNQTVDSCIDSISFEDVSTAINGDIVSKFQCYFEIPIVIPNQYSQCKLEINLLVNVSDKFVDDSLHNINIFDLKEGKFVHSKKLLYHFSLYSSIINLSTVLSPENVKSSSISAALPRLDRGGDFLESPWSKNIEMLSSIMCSLNESALNSLQAKVVPSDHKMEHLEFFFPKFIASGVNSRADNKGDATTMGLFSGASLAGNQESVSSTEHLTVVQGQSYDAMLKDSRTHLQSMSSSLGSGDAARHGGGQAVRSQSTLSPKFSKILTYNDFAEVSNSSSNSSGGGSSNNSSNNSNNNGFDFRISKETLHFNSRNAAVPSVNCDVVHAKYDDFQAACQIYNQLSALSIEYLSNIKTAHSNRFERNFRAASNTAPRSNSSGPSFSAKDNLLGGGGEYKPPNDSAANAASSSDFDNYYNLPDRLRQAFSEMLDIYSFFKVENRVTGLIKISYFHPAGEAVQNDFFSNANDANATNEDELLLETQLNSMKELKLLFADAWKMFKSLREIG